MSKLRDMLELILARMSKLNRPVAKLLQPGLTQSSVQTHLRRRSLFFPDQLYELYSWRDGTASSPDTTLDDMHFFPWRYFMPLHEAVASYESLLSTPNLRWSPRLFPLFHSGGGDYHFIEIRSADSQCNPIRYHFQGNSEMPVIFDSVLAMMTTIEQCYARGAYSTDEEGSLDLDSQMEKAIRQELNPTLEYWFDPDS